jgi:hypothetical protein
MVNSGASYTAFAQEMVPQTFWAVYRKDQEEFLLPAQYSTYKEEFKHISLL